MLEQGRQSADDGAPDDSRADVASPASGAAGPRSLLALVTELESVATEIARHDPAAVSGTLGAELSVRAHRAVDRVRSAQLGWLGRVESDAAWVGTGARSVVAWTARTHDVSFTEARGWISTARVWRDTLGLTARAARSGLLSTAKGTLIARTATTPARIEALLTDPEGEVARHGPHADASSDLDSGESSKGDGTTLPDAAGLPDGARRQDGSAPSSAGPRTGEAVLVSLASGYDVAAFTKIARRFAHVTDPEADERGYREALAREHFDLAATTGGYHLSGFLTFDHGQAVKTAMRAVTGAPTAGDTRTAGQRRAAALTGIARLVLDKGLTGKVGTVRPHVSVHVSLTELTRVLHGELGCAGSPAPPAAAVPPGCPAPAKSRASSEAPASSQMPGESTAPTSSGVHASTGIPPGLEPLLLSPPAEWEDGTIPVPDAVLRRIATDCEITRVVLGADSQVLDVGRTQRTFAGHLRRAVVARDRHCVVPGCTAPPSMSQVHHASTRWADGGATSIENAALVCGFHNRWLEDHRVPIRRVVDENGLTRWQLGVPGTYRPGGGGRFVEDGAWQRQAEYLPPDVRPARRRGRMRGTHGRDPSGHDLDRGSQDRDEPP